MNTVNIGYVYILGNGNYAELKIGYTLGNVEQRARELYTTGMAHPLEVIFYAAVENPYEIEQYVHRILNNKRVVNNREFFQCSLDIAILAIKEAANHFATEILKEWRNPTTEHEKKIYDSSVWPTRAQGAVQKIVTDHHKILELAEARGAVILQSAPADDCSDFNQFYEWASYAGTAEFNEMMNLRILTFEQQKNIEMLCKGRNDQEINEYFKQLDDYLSFHNYLTTKSYKKVYSKRMHFYSKIKRTLQQVIFEVKHSSNYAKVFDRMVEIEQTICSIEKMLIEIPETSKLNFNELMHISTLIKDNFSIIPRMNFENIIEEKINALHIIIKGDNDIHKDIQTNLNSHDLLENVIKKMSLEVKKHLTQEPGINELLFEGDETWESRIMIRYRLVFDTAMKIKDKLDEDITNYQWK